MFSSNSLPLSDTREPICPHCLSGPVMARGRISAGGAGMIRTEYRCPDCAKEFVFLRRVGLTSSPQQFTTSPQWSHGP
jgi:transposase-like protein